MRNRYLPIICTFVTLAGCNDLVGNPALPSGTQDPSVYNTPSGVLQQVTGTRGLLRGGIVGYLMTSGELTDELTFQLGVANYDLNSLLVDQRQTRDNEAGSPPSTPGWGDYRNLQGIRGQAHLVQLAIPTYAPKLPVALRGEMYASEAYADVLLAELFCSGVPLTNLNLGGSFDYAPSSTSTDTYQTAIALFDSAAALAGDSLDILTLARVGKARALLGLGQYAAAADAVADVHDGDAYTLHAPLGLQRSVGNNVPGTGPFELITVADREGGNGYPYRSSGDPRTAVTTHTDVGSGQILFQPAKYITQTLDSSTVVLADWIEARLIQAEATLQSTPNVPNETAMQMLNALRAHYIAVDSLTPIPSGLTWNQQVDTLFYERAAWMFLTGHRQGDLRRLIRQYGREPNLVYPFGLYPGPNGHLYGSFVNLAIPSDEYNNPLFHGCLSRGA